MFAQFKSPRNRGEFMARQLTCVWGIEFRQNELTINRAMSYGEDELKPQSRGEFRQDELPLTPAVSSGEEELFPKLGVSSAG